MPFVFMLSCVTMLCQVSADSVIKTMGGDVSIKRLVGTTIDVDTSGGDIYIGSLYGNGMHLLDLYKQIKLQCCDVFPADYHGAF